MTATQDVHPNSGSKLNGWKETAAYLGRSVRTVQRWEVLGLPVHRPLRGNKSSILAFKTELDAWAAATPVNRAELFVELQVEIRRLEEENECLKQLLLHAIHSSEEDHPCGESQRASVGGGCEREVIEISAPGPVSKAAGAA